MSRKMLVTAVIVLAACGEPSAPAGPRVDAAPFASCSYVNAFSRSAECREYLGGGWTAISARQDCRMWSGTLTVGGVCDVGATLGRCVLDEGAEDELEIVFPGSDAGACAATQNGCTTFAGGTFEPSATCEGTPPPTPGGSVFEQPTLSCVAPADGEPAGASDGQVCTWTAISGCTEPGRRFADYGSCDTVRTQRPYYPVPPATTAEIPGDTRSEDEAYLAELGWVTEQVEACACVCCHSSELSPDGPSNWFLEHDRVWVDSMGPNGLALAAGWVDSTALGAYPPEENNGFDRSSAGIPTTDAPRMRAFFEGELARRGLTREDFADVAPFGGPLYGQLVYEPVACAGDVGIDAEGRVRWEGGGARYVYVLEEGSGNPLVPPNLDLPEGTMWRLDVRSDAAPIESGIAYGASPEGTTQRVPTSGAPPALTSGSTYYLYVTADVAIPLARCLFVAP